MPFVVDASMAVCWAFRDEEHPHADLALARMAVNERGNRLTEAETAIFLRDVAHLPITLDRAPGEDEVLRLARTHHLTVYDAAYLELAQRNRMDLATLDSTLARAARAEGVPLIGEGA